jgi:uracil phosphoribosyltransferase
LIFLNRLNFINEQFINKKYKKLLNHTTRDKVMKTLYQKSINILFYYLLRDNYFNQIT